MSGGELFGALFFYPPSVIIDTKWAIPLLLMDCKSLIQIIDMDSTKLGLKLCQKIGGVGLSSMI